MTQRIEIPSEIATLGDAVRYLRTQRGMTLRALAKVLDVSAPFLSDLEHNRRSTEKMDALAAALDVDVETLEQFDPRIDAAMKAWIQENPDVVGLLRDLKASGRPVSEARSTLQRSLRRRKTRQ